MPGVALPGSEGPVHHVCMVVGALAASSGGGGVSPGFALAGNVVVAVVALSGVFVAQRAAARRERDAQMWDRRTALYLDLMAWVIEAKEAIQGDLRPGLRDDISDEEVAALEPSAEVKARAQALASAAVRHVFGSAVRSRYMLQHADRTSERFSSSYFGAELRAFDSTLDELHRGIREELERGSTRRSLAQRWRMLRWRWHRLRGRVKRKARVREARRAQSLSGGR
jgi:hypothetical protein